MKHFHFFLIWERPLHYLHRPQTLNFFFWSKFKTANFSCSQTAKMVLTLSAYNYKIEHRTGANNGNADALSRKPLVQNNVNAREDKTNND